MQDNTFPDKSKNNKEGHPFVLTGLTATISINLDFQERLNHSTVINSEIIMALFVVCHDQRHFKILSNTSINPFLHLWTNIKKRWLLNFMQIPTSFLGLNDNCHDNCHRNLNTCYNSGSIKYLYDLWFYNVNNKSIDEVIMITNGLKKVTTPFTKPLPHWRNIGLCTAVSRYKCRIFINILTLQSDIGWHSMRIGRLIPFPQSASAQAVL